MCLFSHQSLVLFSRQSLAVVVVIVYGFDRLALPLSFFSRRFFLLLLLSACIGEEVEVFFFVFSVRTFFHPSIFLPTSFFFFFFSLLTHNESWHEKLEMTEKQR